ncbi:MAG: hypothetical protein E7454_06620 [Ruminococcaceae bacterium]|nr:hypothetical protein [Oscillospiraceae bacterium]
MKSYTLKKISGAPNWGEIPTLNIDIVHRPADVRAWAQLCWDETGIYVNLKAEEQDIRCEENGPLAMICLDSCLECFIRPTEALSYFNFEFNPAGKLYLGYGVDMPGLVRLAVQDEQATFHPQPYRTDNGWGLTFQIPFTFIQHFLPEFKAYEGLNFYGNCYKCGDHTNHPHYLSWNTLKPGVLDFHCPAYFGRMILGGEEI